jgi:hypothetical protein
MAIRALEGSRFEVWHPLVAIDSNFTFRFKITPTALVHFVMENLEKFIYWLHKQEKVTSCFEEIITLVRLELCATAFSNSNINFFSSTV